LTNKTLEIVDTGIVYRNPAPHLRAIHTWHPSLALLSDGTLVSTFDLGQGVESFDYRTYLSRSSDSGKTWSDPVRLCHDPDPRRHTHSIRIGRMPDDSLVGIGGRFLREHDEEGLVNRANLGYVPMDLFTINSQDSGLTWSSPATIAPPLEGPSFEVAHRVIELKDGRWLAPLSTWKGWNGEVPNGMQAIALVSHDRGSTWPEYLKVMDAYAEGIIHWEQSMVELSDARLLSVAWVVNESSGETLPTRFAISADGKSFDKPQPNGMLAQTCKIIALRDGRIVGLYRHAQKSGLWGTIARIEGDRWETLWDGLLWQGPSYARVQGENAAEDLSGLKLGYPSLVELPSGEVFAVFWCNEDCIHNIRWMRLKA
jgi:sialidase-1